MLSDQKASVLFGVNIPPLFVCFALFSSGLISEQEHYCDLCRSLSVQLFFFGRFLRVELE